MSARPPSSSLFSATAPTLPGAASLQRLQAGEIIWLTARRAHLLRVASGCAWVTLGKGPVDSLETAGVRGGDVFLHAGDLLRVPAGARAVIEAARGMELRFVWQPGDAIARQVARQRGPRANDAPDAAACC